MPLNVTDVQTFRNWVLRFTPPAGEDLRSRDFILRTIEQGSTTLEEAKSLALIYVDSRISSIQNPDELSWYHDLSREAVRKLTRTDPGSSAKAHRWLLQLNGEDNCARAWAEYLDIDASHVVTIPPLYNHGGERWSKTWDKEFVANYAKKNKNRQTLEMAWNDTKAGATGKVVLVIWGHGRLYKINKYGIGGQTAETLIDSLTERLQKVQPCLKALLAATGHLSVMSCESIHMTHELMDRLPHIPSATYLTMYFDPSNRCDGGPVYFFAHDGNKQRQYPLLPALGVMVRDGSQLVQKSLDPKLIASQISAQVSEFATQFQLHTDSRLPAAISAQIGAYMREV